MSPDEILARASAILRNTPGLQREFLASLGVEAVVRVEFYDHDGDLRTFEGSIERWREELNNLEDAGFITSVEHADDELYDFHYEILLEKRLTGGHASPSYVFEAAKELVDRGELMPEDLRSGVWIEGSE